MKRVNQNLRWVKSKRSGVCAECGESFAKGARTLYDPMVGYLFLSTKGNSAHYAGRCADTKWDNYQYNLDELRNGC